MREKSRVITRSGHGRRFRRVVLLLIGTAVSLPCGLAPPAASARATRPIIFRLPNLQVSCFLSDAFQDPGTGETVRSLSFTVFNSGPVSAGASTTLVQLEVGHPGAPLGSAISLFPIATPGMDAGDGWVFHTNVPGDTFVRVHFWADGLNAIAESNEGDNHAVCVSPFPVIPPWIAPR